MVREFLFPWTSVLFSFYPPAPWVIIFISFWSVLLYICICVCIYICECRCIQDLYISLKLSSVCLLHVWLCWSPLLCEGSRCGGSLAVERGLSSTAFSSCGSRASLPHSTCDLPWPGVSPAPPALEGRLFTTEPPGNSYISYLTFFCMYTEGSILFYNLLYFAFITSSISWKFLYCCSVPQLCLFMTSWAAAPRLPCPSPSPGLCSNSCPIWGYDIY